MGKGEESSAETQAHNINGRQKTNCGGTKGKVGEAEGGEEEIGGFRLGQRFNVGLSLKVHPYS